MVEVLKTYSQEQMDRLGQFKRAEGIVQRLLQRQPKLDRGVRVVLFDGNEGHAFDAYQTRAMVGALTGMYMECMDLGLKDAISEHN